MSAIGDEIREFVRRSYADEYMDPGELLALAGRVDRETVPRPRAADGEPVVEGETLYDGEGNEWTVSDVTTSFKVTAESDASRRLRPETARFSHTRPDSLEAIAGELDDLSESGEMADETSAGMRELAGRIRNIARGRDDG